MADEAEVVVPEEGVVEIALDGGEPQKVAAEAVVEKSQPRKEASPELDEATKALQAAVDSERRLRTAAEQTAITARQQAEQARGALLTREQELEQARQSIETRELASIEAGITSATREISGAQKELSAAMSAGEFEKVAEVQTRLAKASAALDRLEAKKVDYESTQQARPTTEGAVIEQQPIVQANPFERYISGMDPPAQTWLRAHPECAPTAVGGNGDMNAKMMRGHYDALARGFPANSEQYFRVIDELAGFRKPEVAADEAHGSEQQKPKPQQRQAQPSAPPSREPPGAQQTGSTRTVRLDKDEQDAARFSFPNLEPAKAYAEYAKNKVQLTSEGKLGRTSH